MYLKEIIETWKKPLKFRANYQIRKDHILKIVEAGRWSPSAENQQVWRFLVIDNEKGKEIIIQSVITGDPRLSVTSLEIKDPKLTSRFIFSIENFNAETDKYKDLIFKDNLDKESCAKTASTFIICTHKDTWMGRTFGFLDLGAAISNIILTSYNLGYNICWFRKFDREFIRTKFNLPKSIYIDAIIGIGKADKLYEISEMNTKRINDFYFHNLWNENLDQDFLTFNQSKIKDYNIEVIDAIVDRRSIRRYNPTKTVPKKLILELLRAGLMIPLMINKPYIKLIIIDSESILNEVAKSAKIVIQQSHVKKVPLIMVTTYDCSNNSAGFYAEIDSGSITQNMLLRAHTLGLGSCWIGAFNRNIVRKILNIPKNWHIPSLVIFGFPSNYPKPTPRVDLGKICFYNSWKNYIEKRHRTFLPNYHVLSVSFRKFKKTRVNTILRNRKVGIIKGIPEFENISE